MLRSSLVLFFIRFRVRVPHHEGLLAVKISCEDTQRDAKKK